MFRIDLKCFLLSTRSIQLPNGLRALLISDRLPERSSDSKDDDGSAADERLVGEFVGNKWWPSNVIWRYIVIVA